MTSLPVPSAAHLVFSLLTLAVLLKGLLLAARLVGKLLSSRPVEAHYEARRPFLSPAERSFFGVLQQAVDGRVIPLAKVRLADLIKTESGLSPQRRTALINRIALKHVDFVLCDAGTMEAVGVIELDDKSHRAESRRKRDLLVDAALASAGLPVLHLLAERAYSLPELRHQWQVSFGYAAPRPARPIRPAGAVPARVST